jgi:hydrogenase maturation factor
VSAARPAGQCVADHGRCITCSDEGIEVTVVAIDVSGARGRGADGTEQPVEIDLVAPVELGDRLLVHAGVAIAQLPAPDAT